MKGIIAVNNLGYIGLNKSLPWSPNKKDFKHFKEKTMGCTLLVGYNTYSTLPHLEGRSVLMDIRGDYMFNPELNVLEKVDWCIGGKKTYEKFCHLFTELHISHINDNTIGDTTFPDFRNLNPECKIFNYNF